MERDPLPLTSNYFDDVINTSYTQATYELTVDSHFEVLERAIERLAFHGAKINVLKCSFAFTKIYFLGWFTRCYQKQPGQHGYLLNPYR